MSGRRLSQQALRELAASLSADDRAILASLGRVGVATGAQLRRLHFAERPSAARQARRSLQRLSDQRLLCRLQRRIGGVRAGSDGYVYALDVAGLRLSGQARARRPRTPGIAFLAHALAVSELYVGLVERGRSGRSELLEFVAEPACWRRYAGPSGASLLLKPDAYLRLGVGAFEDRWFVEVDRGSEGPSTLAHKARAYTSYWQSGREQPVFPKVLFVVPDEARKAVMVDVLAALPSETWPLFGVGLSETSVALLAGERP